jgi:hypothetical protein
VTLEDALVFGAFHRYLASRIGRFLAVRCAQLLLHVCELGLLFLFARREVFIAAAAVSLGAQAATAAWWGGLESLRMGVRRRADDGRFAAISTWVYRWLIVAILLATTIITVTLLVAVLTAAHGRFDIGTAYVTARLIGLAIEIGVRTFHNGVYAIRRVYQPMWSLIAPSLVRGVVLLMFWPVASTWALPPASLCGTLVAAAVTIHFSRRAYDQLQIPLPIRARPGRTRRWFTRQDVWTFLAGAATNLVANATHLLALAVLSLTTGDSVLWLDIFVFVVLAAPMLDGASGWARLFYPDLVALEDDVLRIHLRHLQRQMTKWAPVVGSVLWLPTVAVLWLIPYVDDAAVVAAVTWLFFVARARIAAVQMIAFCAARYTIIVGLTLALAGAAWLAAVDPGEHTAWLVTLLALATLLVPGDRFNRPSARPLLPLAALLARAPALTGRGAWVVATLRLGRLLHGSQLLLHRFARRVGTAAIVNDRLVVWWEPEARVEGAGARLHTAFATRQWRSPQGDALEGLAAMRGQLGLSSEPARTVDLVIEEFASLFPTGTCLRAGRVASGNVRNTHTWKERQRVLDEAEGHLYGRSPRRALSVDVTAFVDDGSIAAIFLVPRDVPATRRRLWRRRLRETGVANAIARATAPSSMRAVTTAGEPDVPTRTPDRPRPPLARFPESSEHGSPASGMYESAIE